MENDTNIDTTTTPRDHTLRAERQAHGDRSVMAKPRRCEFPSSMTAPLRGDGGKSSSITKKICAIVGSRRKPIDSYLPISLVIKNHSYAAFKIALENDYGLRHISNDTYVDLKDDSLWEIYIHMEWKCARAVFKVPHSSGGASHVYRDATSLPPSAVCVTDFATIGWQALMYEEETLQQTQRLKADVKQDQRDTMNEALVTITGSSSRRGRVS